MAERLAKVDPKNLEAVTVVEVEGAYEFGSAAGVYRHKKTGKLYIGISGFRWTNARDGRYVERYWPCPSEAVAERIGRIARRDNSDGRLASPIMLIEDVILENVEE